MNKSIQWKFSRKRKLFIIIAIVVTVGAFAYDISTVYTKENNEIIEGLSSSLIRFHVIANSDTKEDQALKVTVKDEVILKMHELLKDANTIDDSRELINEHMEDLKALAMEVIQSEGYNYPVEISLGQEVFPLKKYGDVVLPPGQYEALVIRIGEAKGKNWWCVLFPPLCFVDATHGVVDESSKQQLKKVLSEEEYNSIVMSKNSDVNVKVSLKSLEWLKGKEEEIKNKTTFANLLK